MTGDIARDLVIAGLDGTGLWISVPEEVGAGGTDNAHWHPSVRVVGINGFSGTSTSGNLWVEGLQEFVDALGELLDQDASEADLDLDLTQVTIIRRDDGVIKVGADLEDAWSDSTVSCTFNTTLEALVGTLGQARDLLALASA